MYCRSRPTSFKPWRCRKHRFRYRSRATTCRPCAMLRLSQRGHAMIEPLVQFSPASLANKARSSSTVRALVASVLLCNLTFTVQAAEIQVGFSPEGSAEQLVLNVIQGARQQIRLMAYSFTSPSVVKALVQ
ncbi:Endonuclease, partial [Pseudomonas cannabina]